MQPRTLTEVLDDLAPLVLRGEPSDSSTLAALQVLLGELRQGLGTEAGEYQSPTIATCALLMQRLKYGQPADTAYVIATLREGITTLQRILQDAGRARGDEQVEMPVARPDDRPMPSSFLIAWWS